MKVIAKTTFGVIIEATTDEVIEILHSVNGKKPESIEIGQKIPAIDYAGSIQKVKHLSEISSFRVLSEQVDRFSSRFLHVKRSYR